MRRGPAYWSVAASMMLACTTTPSSSVDAAVDDASIDALVEDAAPSVDAQVVQPPLTTEAGRAPNLSCVGNVIQPVGGPDVMAAVGLREFLSTQDLVSQPLEIFPGNAVLEGACVPPDCEPFVSGTTGEVIATRPTGFFAYRLPASGQTLEVRGVSREWFDPGAGRIPILGYARSTVTTVGAILRRDFVATRGEVVGAISDCDRAGLANASVRLFVDGVEQLGGTDRSSPRITGMMCTSPSPDGLTRDGTFAAANIPPGRLVVEVWGVRRAGDAPELIACEEIAHVAESVSSFLLLPLRADYEPGSQCASPPGT